MKGKVERKSYFSQSRLPARLMSEESYQLIVEVPRGCESLGEIASDRIVSSSKKENLAF